MAANRQGKYARGLGQRRGELAGKRIHWARTLAGKGTQTLRREHLRFQTQQTRGGDLHCFLLDCSGSMLAGQRLARVLGVLRQLMQRIYQQRAQVAIVGFSGARALLHLDISAARPSGSRALAEWLRPIGAGGGTPLVEGVRRANVLLERAARANPAQRRWLWLFTDGRCDDSPPPPLRADIRIVVDCEHQRIALGRCLALAQRWLADYRSANDLLDDPSM